MQLFIYYLLFSGNLLTRSLIDLVNKKDFVLDSEYLATLLVVVPKYVFCRVENERASDVTLACFLDRVTKTGISSTKNCLTWLFHDQQSKKKKK